jgi:hypothetical protein
MLERLADWIDKFAAEDKSRVTLNDYVSYKTPRQCQDPESRNQTQAPSGSDAVTQGFYYIYCM